MSIGAELRLFVVLGLLLAPVAGAMAFLITYGEYSRHQLGPRRPILMALETAVVSMAVILVLMVVVGFLLGRWQAAAL